MTYTPTLRARRVARELKRLRKERKLTGDEVCQRLLWDLSKLSRMENANMRVTSGEVMELLEVYEVTGQERADLVQLARDARKKGWWQEYADEVKDGFTDYLALEDEARTWRGYQTQVVSGLLQTEGYARAVFRGSQARTPEEVERGVNVRLARQERLTTSVEPLHVWVVLDEAVIHRVVDTPEVMRAQLEHLLELGELANVSIQVLSYGAGVHPAIDGPFNVLTFDGYPDVLYVEHLMGCIYMEKPIETVRGNLIFEHLRAAALNTSDTAELIRKVLRES